MSPRRGFLRIAAVAAAAASTLSVGMTTAAASSHHSHHARSVQASPAKFYGVYVSQAPASMTPIQRVTQQTGKAPDMSLFYRAWDASAAQGVSNISTSVFTNACNAGMLPMMTWESWDTSVTQPGQGVAWAQPAFAPSVIAGGRYDAYIRAVADSLKQVHCTVAVRLDQELNSYWYPWGLNTEGMHNTPADYVSMWQHVWNIFHAEHVTNVRWVWSPNVQSKKHPNYPALSDSYPGDQYVDWIGVDGYLKTPDATFHSVFQPTFTQLRGFVPDKPWVVGEVGVSTSSRKAHQLHNVVAAVARRKRLIGMNYFDINKYDGNFLIDETSQTLDAFRRAIANPVYAAGVPGQPPAA
jgi:mannan endo-1,4-beta-mannosidase